MGGQDPRRNAQQQDPFTTLQEMFKSRLILWQKHNQRLPENIVIYRDGVSEGQYHLVLDHELVSIRAACRSMYLNKALPKLTVAIVGKRHHTRFYAWKEETFKNRPTGRWGWGNPDPGTFVDRVVTDTRNWDFFLQAHDAIKGTARPAHYFVLLDEIFAKGPALKPSTNATDTFIQMTHSLCYLYGRATKSVSVCPPAYLADLACTRARMYLKPSALQGQTDSLDVADATQVAARLDVHERVKDTMFYI